MTAVSVFYLLMFVIGVLLGVIGVLVYRLLQAEKAAYQAGRYVNDCLDHAAVGQWKVEGPAEMIKPLLGSVGSPSPTPQWEPQEEDDDDDIH